MIIEEAFSYENLLKHIKHVIQYVDDPRCKKEAQIALSAIEDFGKKYNEIADELTYAIAGTSEDINSEVVGFISKDGRYCKYNRKTKDFIAYDPNSKVTVTMHKKTEAQYNKIRERDFKSELPNNQD